MVCAWCGHRCLVVLCCHPLLRCHSTLRWYFFVCQRLCVKVHTVKREAVIAGLASEGLELLLGSAEAGSSAVVRPTPTDEVWFPFLCSSWRLELEVRSKWLTIETRHNCRWRRVSAQRWYLHCANINSSFAVFQKTNQNRPRPSQHSWWSWQQIAVDASLWHRVWQLSQAWTSWVTLSRILTV